MKRVLRSLPDSPLVCSELDDDDDDVVHLLVLRIVGPVLVNRRIGAESLLEDSAAAVRCVGPITTAAAMSSKLDVDEATAIIVM